MLDEQETLSADEQGSESDDGDMEMKDLEGRAAQNIGYNNQMPFNDEDMLNQEIEDIDSDDDQLLVMQQQQQQKVNKNVPGLQLGGLGMSMGNVQGNNKMQLNSGNGQKQPNQKITHPLTDQMLDAMSGRQSSKREVTRLNINKAIAY